MITEARIATTDNITLSGAQALQGVALVASDVVLVCGQTNGATNGPYVVQSGAWSRHTDHDTDAEIVRPWSIFIREGTFANWRFQFTNETTPILGTSILNFDPYATEELLQGGSEISIDYAAPSVDLPGRFALDPKRTGAGATLGFTPGGTLKEVTIGAEAYAALSGFLLRYFSTTRIDVYLGSCFVTTQDAAGLTDPAWATSPDLVSLTTTGLSANTLYYVYTAPVGNGLSTSVEFSTTGPTTALAESVTHFVRPDDSSRRYLGTFRTNGSGVPYNFLVTQPGKFPLVSYLEDTTASPFRVVSSGAATTNQTVNLGPSGLKLVPPTCRMVYARVAVNTTASVWIDNSEMGTSPAAGTGEFVVTTAERVQYIWLSLDANQSFRWANTAAGGSTSIDIKKYTDRR